MNFPWPMVKVIGTGVADSCGVRQVILKIIHF